MEFPSVPRTGLGLRDIFSQAYRAKHFGGATGTEQTPFEGMLQRSQAIGFARQGLPKWMGGLGPERMGNFDQLRQADAKYRHESVRAGEYPSSVPIDRSATGAKAVAQEAARRGAQAAGVLAADTTSQGALNLWWFVNAFQAAAAAAGQEAMHGALGAQKLGPWNRPAIDGAPTGSPLRGQHYKVSATFPLIMAASAATGSLFRQPGYSAVLRDDEDATQSTNPVMEKVLNAIGMTGRMLPYDEFVKERPDVSKGDYESYKAFLYGNPLPIKVTGDGIHGPEVNLMGKSIPVLTGIVPVAAGVLGARMGVRRAGERLANRNGVNEFRVIPDMESSLDALRSSAKAPGISRDVRDQLKEQVEVAQQQLAAKRLTQADLINDQLLKGALVGSSVSLGVTGAGAALLEQMRRASNYEENKRRQEEQMGAQQEPVMLAGGR